MFTADDETQVLRLYSQLEAVITDGAYDVETAGNDWSWRFLQQVQMASGPVFWTTSTLPSNGPARFFRMRYPSSR